MHKRSGAATEALPLSFLAFDYGSQRVGVATGNTVIGHATALTTLTREGQARFDAIERLLAEWKPDALVVGVPFHPDGAAHENTSRARRFARQLQGRFGLPVHEVDERYSTTEALADPVSNSREADTDSAAAAIILNQYLATLARHGDAAA
jgi:putative holliday junction resolvase